jgi:hypothetical protein
MALELVTARARTRGKSPVEFTYQGYGKLAPRKVTGKDGEAVKREDGTEIEVDDLEVEGIVTAEDFDSVLALFDGNIVKMLEATLIAKNAENRKAASPVTETVTEDELSPIVAAMLENGILADKDVAVWRRTVSTASKQVEMSRLDYAGMTKEFKALKRLGKVPATA